ncbi:MAG: hypothetical protein IJ318_02990 [Clostridia bacterium]|nr:hypothetical protein [Clostridia bacterium]
MDYENMTAKEFRDAYALRREQIYSKIEYVGSIKAEKILFEEYEQLCADAASGDPVAEDLLAEWFRNGNQIVPENIEMSMKWLILAGANGNKFSLDRLKLQFGYAFDTIINLSDFGQIAYKFKIHEYNYQHILGKLLCDAVIDDMKINALELAKQKPFHLPFSSVILRTFDRSINRAVEKVIEYLRR